MKFKTVPEKNWKNYLLKAEQFLESAHDALSKENWNAVSLNALHSAISANDAITVFFKNIRSASGQHGNAVELLLMALPGDSQARANSRHFSWLINHKNLIEYESRLFYQKEALDCLRHADRFLAWAKERVGS
jgi:hypothetical protein